VRWGWIAAGLVAVATVALGAARVESWWGGRAAPGLPSQLVTRGELALSAVALGAVRPQVGAEVEVGSRLSGVVVELHVAVGDRVSPGDLLARLRDDDWRARVEVLRAERVAARAEAEFAAGELARAQSIVELLPALELERLRRDLAVRRAQVARVEASLAQAEIDLGYTVVRAPIAGTVASVSTSVGETVAASFAAPTFVTLIDLDRLEVQAYVDETDIGHVAVGEPVALRLDAFPGRELTGQVRAVYPRAELVNSVVNYVVLVSLADTGGLAIRPEMTVHVDFPLERRADAVQVPRAALFEDATRAWVVVEEGGRWVERDVVSGLRTPQRVEIVSGLAAGDRIVADKQAWRAWEE
jgi:RND family efflux transporter MFP subunit